MMASRNGPILSVQNLEKTFGSLVAARDITISVPAEQTIGVIGANGAGKTTFINMITGHLTPTRGSIFFEDREITWLSWLEKPLAKIGKLDQLSVVVGGISLVLAAELLAEDPAIVMVSGVLGMITYIAVNGLGHGHPRLVAARVDIGGASR